MFTHKSYLRIGSLDNVNTNNLLANSTELAKCNYSFTKAIDDKGEVQSKAQGGIIEIELLSLPSKPILEWALKPRKYQTGMIVFCDDSGTPLEKIFFYDAACISMEITYLQTGSAYMKTSLILSAKKMMIGENIFESRWINK